MICANFYTLAYHFIFLGNFTTVKDQGGNTVNNCTWCAKLTSVDGILFLPHTFSPHLNVLFGNSLNLLLMDDIVLAYEDIPGALLTKKPVIYIRS